MACDPNFADDVTLLFLDGANGTSTIVDSSTAANSYTANGAAAFDNFISKFATTSLHLTGANADNVTLPLASGDPMDILPPASGDFTIEGWFYFTSAAAFTPQQELIEFTTPGSVDVFRMDITPSFGAHGIFQLNTNIPGWVGIGGNVPNITNNTWHHWAIVRSGGTGKIYLDGNDQGFGGTSWSTAFTTPVGTSVAFGRETGFGGSYLEFWIGPIRVTKGLARYTSNFTPPASNFGLSCAVTVPNVIGDNLGVGEAAITGAGLTVGVLTPINFGIPGQITIQSPVGGTIVTPPASVDLTYTLGFPVPDVFNTSRHVAQSIIESAGLTLGLLTFVNDVLIITGNVDGQSPAAGTYVLEGSPVNLQISLGRGGVVVPDLIGLTEAQAINAIVSVGLTVGTINSQPNNLFPAGIVALQNPESGITTTYGNIVSFTLSSGSDIQPPYKLVQSNFECTDPTISQYANSPTLLQLIDSMCQYIDPTQNIQNFYDFVWNVDTAQGFGLDIWGAIVNVSRLLYIPVATPYVGFQDGTGPGWDVQPFGRANPPSNPLTLNGLGGEGTFYTRQNATQSYLLDDSSYRRLIFVKALANIVETTVPALNQLLRNLFPGRGNPYVQNNLNMTMVFHFDFDLTPIELAILQQSGAVPVPPGVSFTIVEP